VLIINGIQKHEKDRTFLQSSARESQTQELVNRYIYRRISSEKVSQDITLINSFVCQATFAVIEVSRIVAETRKFPLERNIFCANASLFLSLRSNEMFRTDLSGSL